MTSPVKADPRAPITYLMTDARAEIRRLTDEHDHHMKRACTARCPNELRAAMAAALEVANALTAALDEAGISSPAPAVSRRTPQR